MKSTLLGLGLGLGLGLAMISSGAAAQQVTINQNITGTRLDIVATAEVSRVPDIATVSAGVVSRSSNAAGALGDSAAKMNRMIASLKHAGIAEADIQTSNISLNPEYRYPENQPPQLVGYSATNTVKVRFHNITNAGKILDALVSEGGNQINGPVFAVEHPDEALDEARTKAITLGRARAELYAHSLGLRVLRVVSVNEEEGGNILPQGPVMMEARAVPATKIVAGEQALRVSVAMTFELQ